MTEVSPETLIAIGIKNGNGYIGIRPPLPIDFIERMGRIGVIHPGTTDTVSHPDGDYTTVNTGCDLQATQDRAYNLAFVVGLRCDAIIIPIYEPVAFDESNSSPFVKREDYQDLQV